MKGGMEEEVEEDSDPFLFNEPDNDKPKKLFRRKRSKSAKTSRTNRRLLKRKRLGTNEQPAWSNRTNAAGAGVTRQTLPRRNNVLAGASRARKRKRNDRNDLSQLLKKPSGQRNFTSKLSN